MPALLRTLDDLYDPAYLFSPSLSPGRSEPGTLIFVSLVSKVLEPFLGPCVLVSSRSTSSSSPRPRISVPSSHPASLSFSSPTFSPSPLSHSTSRPFHRSLHLCFHTASPPRRLRPFPHQLDHLTYPIRQVQSPATCVSLHQTHLLDSRLRRSHTSLTMSLGRRETVQTTRPRVWTPAERTHLLAAGSLCSPPATTKVAAPTASSPLLNAEFG